MKRENKIESIISNLDITHLMAVMQLSRYSIFHDGDTFIQLSLLCQCLNTKTFAWGNKSYTTETLSISYSRNSYIELVVIL